MLSANHGVFFITFMYRIYHVLRSVLDLLYFQFRCVLAKFRVYLANHCSIQFLTVKKVIETGYLGRVIDIQVHMDHFRAGDTVVTEKVGL